MGEQEQGQEQELQPVLRGVQLRGVQLRGVHGVPSSVVACDFRPCGLSQWQSRVDYACYASPLGPISQSAMSLKWIGRRTCNFFLLLTLRLFLSTEITHTVVRSRVKARAEVHRAAFIRVHPPLTLGPPSDSHDFVIAIWR